MPKIFQTSLFSLICAAVLLSGCGPKEPPPLKSPAQPQKPDDDYIVAMVNNTPLTWKAMEMRADGFLNDDVKNNNLIIPESRMEEAKEHFRKRAIKAFVYKSVMLAEAAKNDIVITSADRARGIKALETSLKKRDWSTDDFFNKGPMPPQVMSKEFEDGIIIDKFVRSQVADKIGLEKDEVANLTKKLQESNARKLKLVKDIRTQIIAGADFAEMAERYSECPSSKSKGGDLGEFGRGKMVKAVEKAAFSQKIGEISEIITSPYGYHIIKVTAHSPAQDKTDSTPAIPETIRASHILIKTVPIIKKKIIETLQKEKYQQESKELYRNLLKQADVKCFLYDDIEF
jgi:parvulin-like peptidyl-prolyl isomerase